MVTPYPWGLRGSEFEHYLEQFVIYLLQLGLEALEVLWADRLEAWQLALSAGAIYKKEQVRAILAAESAGVSDAVKASTWAAGTLTAGGELTKVVMAVSASGMWFGL